MTQHTLTALNSNILVGQVVNLEFATTDALITTAGMTFLRSGHTVPAEQFPDYPFTPGTHYGSHPDAYAETRLTSVAISGDTLIAVGAGGRLRLSTDGGVSWADKAVPGETKDLTCVAIDGDSLLAAGDGGALLLSTDGGASWNSKGIPYVKADFTSVAINGDKLVAVGSGGAVRISFDGGANWLSKVASPTVGFNLSSVTIYNNDNLMAVGTDGSVLAGGLTAAGGLVNRTSVSQAAGAHLASNAVNGAVHIAVGEGGTLLRSVNNGQYWSNLQPDHGLTADLTSIATNGDTWVAVGAEGTLLRSVDNGATWVNQQPFHGNADLTSVAVSGDTWVIAGNNGTLLLSTNNGRSWTNLQPVHGLTADLPSVAVSGDALIAAGTNGEVITTQPGVIGLGRTEDTKWLRVR